MAVGWMGMGFAAAIIRRPDKRAAYARTVIPCPKLKMIALHPTRTAAALRISVAHSRADAVIPGTENHRLATPARNKDSMRHAVTSFGEGIFSSTAKPTVNAKSVPTNNDAAAKTIRLTRQYAHLAQSFDSQVI